MSAQEPTRIRPQNDHLDPSDAERSSTMIVTKYVLGCDQRPIEPRRLTEASRRRSEGRFQPTICACWARLWISLKLRRGASLPPTQQVQNTRLQHTLSFDGLRGVACLIVFNFHFLYPYTLTHVRGMGVDSSDGASNLYFHQLPFICLLVRGRAMVTLFFGISGYVLSCHFLEAMRTCQWERGLKRLASLVLRRWLRLFAPATISMTVVMLAAFWGVFDRGAALERGDLLTGQWEPHPRRLSSFAAQLRDLFSTWWMWSNPWVWDLIYVDYHPHLWTIPVEFRCSIVLFALLISCASLKQWPRLFLVTLVTVYCFLSNRWDVAVFTGGGLCADLHQTQRRHHEQRIQNLPQTTTETSKRNSYIGRVMCDVAIWSVLLSGLYLLSFPDELAEKTPGFSNLNQITPPRYARSHHFWHALGAILVLWTVENISPIRKMLTWRVPQYLGKISYALYIVHGPLLHSTGFVLQPIIWTATDTATKSQWLGGLTLGWLTMLCLCLVVAHLFWKLVDTKVVTLTRYLEKLITVPARKEC